MTGVQTCALPISYARGESDEFVKATTIGEPVRVEDGDAEAALKDAAFAVDATYTTPRHNHNAIELHAATVAWDGDTLMVHDATQMVNNTAWTLSDIFGIKEEQVRVSSPFVGGAFGGSWNLPMWWC